MNFDCGEEVSHPFPQRGRAVQVLGERQGDNNDRDSKLRGLSIIKAYLMVVVFVVVVVAWYFGKNL